ncbi:MAG: glutamine--fructose-6-phosphate transaminase (isomerizing) [Actinomycetia bacterium]|nr:glutamine--fructose-6-phosphate transaminase (isomerizing) [Actinomycetes bacterium]
MCGIVAYTGRKNCRQILIDGLRRLEYRGYDSAGIAVTGDDKKTPLLEVVKEAGKIRELEAQLERVSVDGHCGIGHTRWATHGEPSRENAHPHLDCSGRIAVVHNGIIENYQQLKTELEAEGHKFVSQTDTEVLAHLLEKYNEGDLLPAMQKVVGKIKGSGAIVAVSTDSPAQLIAARIASPLVVGISGSGNFLASDMPAVLEHTRTFLIIEDYETVRVTPKRVEIFDREGRKVSRKPFKVNWSIQSAEKAGYADFMLKEIFEQPYGIKETMRGRLVDGELDFGELGLDKKQISELKKIQIIACGTSYHAAMVGKQVIEKWARIPVEIDYSSEYRYRDPMVEDNCLFVAITQSGETIDTLAAVREARIKGAKVAAITNVVGSTIARESDSVIYTHAGPEIGVCATKTFTAQLVVIYLMALYFGHIRGTISSGQYQDLVQEMLAVPDKVQQILDNSREIKKIADKTFKFGCFLFLGRIYGLPMALEGALKLKEVSYIHAEGYPSGEMKHGPIALTDRNTVVVGVMPRDLVYEKILGNIQEARARKATLFSITTEGNQELRNYVDYCFGIPKICQELSGILTVVPLQLYSYYIAKKLGRDVDQPRNLAKSVTVE